MQHEIILHQYAGSPFAEKIRLLLGVLGLPWRAVDIPVIMPKPDLVALSGGYRKTPVLQLGADIYCDTALIARKLESLAQNSGSLHRRGVLMARWADTELFQVVVGYIFRPEGMEFFFAGQSTEQIKAFADDRQAMGGIGSLRPSTHEAEVALREYLGHIDAWLQDFPAANAPCIGHFSLYHCLWFVRRAEPVAHILDGWPRVLAWMDAMAAYGHGECSPMSSEEALQVAAAAAPQLQGEGELVQPDEELALGQRVTVAPVDYAKDPVAGELVNLGVNSVSLLRSDERAGQVVVHFPRIGFRIAAA